MIKWLISAFLLCGSFTIAAAQVSFQTHYLPLGQPVGYPVAITVDAYGNNFIIENTDAGIRVTKTDPPGNLLLSFDFGAGVGATAATVAADGHLVVVGTRQNIVQDQLYSEGAIFKLDNALTQVAATVTLGNRATSVTGINAVTTDGSGNIYVTGSTSAQDFPVTPDAYQTTLRPVYFSFADGFVTKYSSDLSRIEYSTYFANTGVPCFTPDACQEDNPATVGTAVAVDSAGVMTITGTTSTLYAGGYGFVIKLSPGASELNATAWLRGESGPGLISYAGVQSLAVDSHGNVLVAGQARNGLPFGADALQPHPHSYNEGSFIGTDNAGFLAEYDSNLNLLWGTYFGAPGPVTAAFDSLDQVWVTGNAQIPTLPAIPSSAEGVGFIAELSHDGSTVLNLTVAPVSPSMIASSASGALSFLAHSGAFLTLGPPGSPSFLTVANSGSNTSSGEITPLELISLYGRGIGPDVAAAGQVVDGAFTNRLGGYQVLFNGTPAPILYAGAGQFNVVAPQAIAGQESVNIEVVGPQGSTAFPTVFVAPSAPQIFLQPGTSTAAALNQDGTANSATNPAAAGSVVTIWVTGTGLTNDGLMDGSIVQAPGSGDVVLPIDVALAQSPGSVKVTYAGNAPGAVLGLTQISFIWTPGVAIGPVYAPVSVQVGNSAATAYIYGH